MILNNASDMYRLAVLLAALSSSCLMAQSYEWEVRWYDGMKIDHFDYADQRTFSLKYLYNDTYFNETPSNPDHPKGIYFYCGNEGSIEMFADNTGQMWEFAAQDGAVVVFAEHRYYGLTQPFGNESYSSLQNLGYLTTDQALADYATLLNYIKKADERLKDAPVIAFGGSYGGMLAAWFRIKYPTVVLGSLASSAPILQFTGYAPCTTYYDTVTYSFSQLNASVPDIVKSTWPAFKRLAQSDDGLQQLDSLFNLCANSQLNSTVDVETLIYWITDSLGSLAMINYPYPSNFIAPVPGWPVNVAAQCFLDVKNPKNATDAQLVTAMKCAVDVYGNYTGQAQCYDIYGDVGNDLGYNGWYFQSCSTMVMPICASNESMFVPYGWNLTAVVDGCARMYWGIKTDPYWAMLTYGGSDLQFADNIIFSNGALDPWSGGGVTPKLQPQPPVGITVLWLQQGAHHYDLRASNPQDTQEVRAIRFQEHWTISNWIYFDAKKRAAKQKKAMAVAKE